MQTTVAVVNHVTVDDLERPTPCAGWTLRDLLAHMTGQNYGWAAAAEGDSADRAVFADRVISDRPADDYAASASRVIEAFSAPDLLDRTMYLPEVRDGVELPAVTAIGFHLVDSVAHGWDVAKCLGVAAEFDDDVLELGLTVAEAVPEEARSVDERAPFRPSVSTTSDDVLDRIVATVGRLPAWVAT